MAETRRHDRHLRLAAAAQVAFADPAFRRDLADLMARCRSSPRLPAPRRPRDIAFDAQHERHEGWALEPIGNVFA